jgi:nucleoside-diphosphate-sugar epimerase
MNILITGAGLIGTNAARHFVDAGHKVVLLDLSPNRDYIEKVVGKDKSDVVAADMRDLPALLAALEKYNVDTLVATAGFNRLARARELLHRCDEQYFGHDQRLGSCPATQTAPGGLRQHLRRL